jgi:PilX N-terminal
MQSNQIIDRSRALREEGSAFVISILVLFILTVLGLALMLTTTTEKDIAINYRWGEQAFFNADAALEYGKNVVGQYLLKDGDFRNILPPARPNVMVTDNSQPWGQALPELACDPRTAGCRDYQYFVDHCPPNGSAPGPCVRVYIGKVLPRPDGTLAQFDFRAPGAAVAGDLDGDGVADLEGTFTLWVRRPIVGSQDYGVSDDLGHPNGQHDRLILTAEGTAPGAMGAGAGKAVSLRRLEMMVRRPQAGIEGDVYGRITEGSDAGTRQNTYNQVQSSVFPSN